MPHRLDATHCPPDGQDGHAAAQTLWLHWTKVFLAETRILSGFDLSSAVGARQCTRDLLGSGQPFCEEQTKIGLVFVVFVVFVSWVVMVKQAALICCMSVVQV